jgi:hypothetical protein
MDPVFDLPFFFFLVISLTSFSPLSFQLELGFSFYSLLASVLLRIPRWDAFVNDFCWRYNVLFK